MDSIAENNEKPTPPRNLKPENIGLWKGWCCKGDREVAREAAAKGIAMDLVALFISQRKKIDLKEAEDYYKNEVLTWVNDLLNRKQIFRVSHILSNIGINPQEELSKIFCNTVNRELREYIGNHLKNQSKLDDNLLHLWHFLEIILNNSLVMSKWKLEKNSIECLKNQESSWKSKIAVKLFLRSYDAKLIPFLTAEAVWKQLLAYHDIKLLYSWNHIHYTDRYDTIEIPDNLLKVFKQFPITNDMINYLNSPEILPHVSTFILNDLCRFGIFCDRDKKNFMNILTRLYNSNNLPNIYEILRDRNSNLTEKVFLNQLVDYCVDNRLIHVMSSCIENFEINEDTVKGNRYLELVLNFRQLIKDFEEPLLRDNIIEVSTFLSENLEVYFKKNPLILLSIILFSKEISMESLIEGKTLKMDEIVSSESIDCLLEQIPSLITITNRKKVIEEEKKLYFYELLLKHYGLNVNQLYFFQFGDLVLPDFTNTFLQKKFGYMKKINYIFYVKQYRPSIASKLYLLNQYEDFKGFPEGDIKVLRKKIFKIVLRNITNIEITSSCVAFLEMIGVNSNFIKITVTVIKILLEDGIETNIIKKMFSNIENNPTEILSILEPIVMKEIDFDNLLNGSYFIKAVNIYDIVVNFTICYDLKLPEMFLKACGANNMWLPFLVFAQMKNYPAEQIKPLVQSFRNPNMLEHLHHSVVHDINIEHNVLMGERDSRNHYLSRIGVRKSLENLNQGGSIYSAPSRSSYGSSSSSGGSDFLEIDVSNTKATLLQTLIRCHSSTDPPRALLQACQLYKNPVLAIFATSYEPDSLITNWLTWLAVSSGLYEVFTNFELIALNSQSVSKLLNDVMKNRFPKTLLQSFEIFMPTNPLRYFVEFLNLCIEGVQDVTILTALLDTFKTSLGQCRRYSLISETDHEMTYSNNIIWIEKTVVELLSSILQFNVTSLHEQLGLVRTLNKIDINKYVNCPDFTNFLDVLEIVYNSNSDIRFNIDLFLSDKGEDAALDECVNAFLDNFRFDDALKVAKIKNVPSDIILIRRWEHKFKTKDSRGLEFWIKCNDEFESRKLTADCVVKFFLEHVSKVETTIEKFELINLAHKWSKNNDLPSRNDLEKEKWSVYITLEEKWRTLDNIIAEETLRLVPFEEMLNMLEEIPVNNKILSPEAINIINTMINDALDNDRFWLAVKLEKIFGCKNPHLDILKLCHSLAEGLVQPQHIGPEHKLFLSKGLSFGRLSHKKTQLFTRNPGNVPPSSSSTSEGPVDTVNDSGRDILGMLSSLAGRITCGVEIAQTILMTYRISINIDIPYKLIVPTKDPMKMLKAVLEENCSNKLEIVHDFVSVYKWTKEQVADLICEEIVTAATKFVQSWLEGFTMWDIKMDEDFNLVLKLLPDNCSSILGDKLYAFASATHKSQVVAALNFKINQIALVIELLIIAHSCYTADCNMEGIFLILKKSRIVVSHLLKLRSWKLIVRLLTGVGRYTEMTYVFEILRENDQFEFLLRKGSRKDNALKAALLEYLKKYCPENKELYKIVALHFTLFSEVATIWEGEAGYVINNLIAIAKLDMQNNKLDPDTEPFILFSNTEDTKMCLNKALEYYTHATEFHLQGEKLTKAMNSAKQAELIALQISLFKGLPNNTNVFCLLNLIEIQIRELITHHLSFDQSLILSESYSYYPEWGAVLFAQFVKQNRTNYLEGFVKHLPLTDSLVNDISRRFLSSKTNNICEINNMKTILYQLPSVHTKYRIASELGFTDFIEDLISSDQLAYLKDTVWKNGYRN
ncbi:spatacsin [Diorhabda carinulata]|uniref:spatacsin n=1 Tax=Diorhabda carinulata TaxID=1163345 RepID=UPI0025A0AA14|nr:spatacsin [Diorhabda carinulata]XP_057655738.1 spatacsin [Diorhabda carinulata]